MGIRAKLTWTMGGLLTIVILTVSSGLYWSERSAILKKTEEARAVLVSQFAQVCRDALAVNDDLALLNAAQMLLRLPTVREAYCRDNRGRILGEGPGSSKRSKNENLRLARKKIEVRPGLLAEAVVGFSIQETQDEVKDTLRGAARRIVFVSAATLAIGILMALVLSGHLIRPVRAIARGTHQIAGGDLGYRLGIQRGDEIGQLATDFNRMAERLGEVDRMKEDFVSNVTHELRSPLGAIQSYVNLMVDDHRSGRHENTMDHLMVVRNNTARLAKFINDILDLAKIEARPKQRVNAPLRLIDGVREVEALFRLKAQEKGVGLTVMAEDESLTALAEEGPVLQIVTNLVSNALKFTPTGGRVTISLSGPVETKEDALLEKTLRERQREPGPKKHVRLSVADTGRGISPADLPRIFDRFEQVKDARDAVQGIKGTGLGLAIARGLAEAQGGWLLAESTVGKGSVFSLYLPEGQ